MARVPKRKVAGFPLMIPLLVGGCSVGVASSSTTDANLEFLTQIQLCRPDGSNKAYVPPQEDQSEDGCALSPIPEGYATVIDASDEQVLWEGEVERDGRFEATFDSSGKFRVEVASPILSAPIVSDEIVQVPGEVVSTGPRILTFEIGEVEE